MFPPAEKPLRLLRPGERPAPHWTLNRAAADGGIILAIVAAILASLFIFVGTWTNAPGAHDLTGTKTEIHVLPAEGVQSFDASPFCADPLTTVRAFPAPDTSGTTYQLTRVRDGKAETVTAVLSGRGDIVLATHYMDTTAGQQSEPAILSATAEACIIARAK